MTVEQVQYILDELNARFEGMYTEDVWLEAKEIAAVILSSDESVYPDETMQIQFDQENELLRTRVGKYGEDGSTFEPLKETAVISYDLIIGISMRKQFSEKSPYKNGSQV